MDKHQRLQYVNLWSYQLFTFIISNRFHSQALINAWLCNIVRFCLTCWMLIKMALQLHVSSACTSTCCCSSIVILLNRCLRHYKVAVWWWHRPVLSTGDNMPVMVIYCLTIVNLVVWWRSKICLLLWCKWLIGGWCLHEWVTEYSISVQLERDMIQLEHCLYYYVQSGCAWQGEFWADWEGQITLMFCIFFH